MKFFARIESSTVVEVLEAEQSFIDVQAGSWIETDPNGVSPKNFAGIGFGWDALKNAFIPIKPYDSWVLNNSTCQWEAPIARPSNAIGWDEAGQKWIVPS